MFDLETVKSFYADYGRRVAAVRRVLGRPLTLTEKILYSHLYDFDALRPLKRLEDFGEFRPDRVAMQDATAQMALLQFMSTGREAVSVPTTVHCDHLICARQGAEPDLAEARRANAEVYGFLASAAARYGIGFWKPGAGIIHQIVLENYAFPGGMMVGTDSHTPNAGGMGMLAIGVGGADAVDVMTGMPWELRMPRIIGVRLTGSLKSWTTPKDVILKLAGMLTVKGGTNAVIEYFGPGTENLSCTGKATVCNMGAEVGATSSVFPYGVHIAEYLAATGRTEVAAMASAVSSELRADDAVIAHPEQYYDEVFQIDLSKLEPHINGPFTPDAATALSGMKDRQAQERFPHRVEVSLIGSCTNSSYQDLSCAASVARGALDAGLKPKARLIVIPGSAQVRATAERDGLLDTLREAGATVMANACGPCIGQWDRQAEDPTRRNSIVTSFNRNFAKRADGNPNTHAFISSPVIAVALAFAGVLDFDPRSDTVDGVWLRAPRGNELPPRGFVADTSGYVPPQPGSPEPVIPPDSERLQRLEPFAPWDGRDFEGLPLLIKVKGKCTTDHISMAGPWLRFRGHLENISDNLLLGAVDAFTGKSGPVAPRARELRDAGPGSIVVAEDNYGEGSSREHAAMEPRFLGVRAVLAKSFARIHETNLKKQGVLALTFANPADYARIAAGDRIDVRCAGIAPGKPVEVVLHHPCGKQETIEARHSYTAQQLAWFRAGSALNTLSK
ncbi:MAG: aconitate hydratase [Bacteroidales bacterium]|nr:aconitate hydratase [Bacteroidales bacterium]